MDHSEFASTVLEALSQSTDDVPQSSINEESKRNAAACMITVLSNRLAKAGQIAEPIGGTTFRWNGGIVNFRNAVQDFLWTNLRTTFAEQIHNEASQVPATYVMAAWPATESEMHVWSVPENVVYEALPNHALDKTGVRRTIRILPAKQRFERCKDSPDLKPYYRLVQLSADESSQLDDAARVDQHVRERKIHESADEAEKTDSRIQRSWIFQANPQIYDIAEALQDLATIRWCVRQFKTEIHAGDTAFIWISGNNAGVLARGTVTCDPDLMGEVAEEVPYYKQAQTDNTEELCVDIKIDRVFDEPISRKLLLDNPVLRSMTILRSPQRTNFALTSEEAAALAAICEQPQSTDSGPTLSSAFAKFHENPVEQLRVTIRRKRAEQLREMLSDVDSIDLDTFNHDVWVFESLTLLDGEDIKGQLFPDQDLSPEYCERIRTAVDVGQLEMHGNYVWGSASHVFGPQLRGQGDGEKLEYVRTALAILNDPKLPPVEKAKQIRDVPGFGFNMATGLVMVKHPDEFAIWNKQSKEAFNKLGYDANDLSSFQTSVRTLREDLGADDFLELDWFLYQVSQDVIQIGQTGSTVGPDATTRYWAMGLGEGGRLWKQCLSDSIIAIGWDRLGDLRQFNTKDEFAEALKVHRTDDKYPINDSLACYQFTHEMAVGDYVFAKQGMVNLYGLGIIKSEYEYDPDRSEYRNVRKVEWLADGHWVIPDNARVPVKTLTDVSNYQSFLKFALPLVEREVEGTGGTEVVEREPYTIDQALKGLFISEERFKDILDSLGRKKNVILQGPPGCGKTFMSKRLAYALLGFKDRTKVAMVQFHQSYAYEDFIQGWRPEAGGGFQLRNGVFYEFCRKASDDEKSNYVFIIDEINRGNLSKIFGELLMLIEADKRGEPFAMPLTYSTDLNDTFYIPSNVHIVGMMNTADRSLAMVDYALRRRFTFVDLRPGFDTEDFQSFLEENDVDSDVIATIISKMLKLNEEIRAEKTNLGPGFEIGHSFFCPQGTEDDLAMAWYRSIIRAEIAPLLREYWFDDLDKAEGIISQLLE